LIEEDLALSAFSLASARLCTVRRRAGRGSGGGRGLCAARNGRRLRWSLRPSGGCRLSDLGDQLEAFSAAVDFEMFRADLLAALGYSDGVQGGRPPFDPVMMFKILVIQAANALSDERAELLINERSNESHAMPSRPLIEASRD
jgi:Transposase domain (DUF772)